MTIGVVVVGALLFKLSALLETTSIDLFPTEWSLSALYDFTLMQAEQRSSTFTKFYMTGFLRDYMLYIYVFFFVAVGGGLILTGAFSFDMSGNAQIRVYEWILVFVMVIAGVAILFAKSRLTAILLNGVLGFRSAFSLCYFALRTWLLLSL